MSSLDCESLDWGGGARWRLVKSNKIGNLGGDLNNLDILSLDTDLEKTKQNKTEEMSTM